ncbi:hypothetical protein GW17_00026646 [Ensete ventricosum]|nr:hypothetical protein GW17_00026646 [Ensete ventricosum]RZR76025.1 hypothetical protein BHM03_00000629 [Ensete ventricosum]
MMQLGTHLECIGSLLKVSRACQDDTREFAGRRPRLAKRLSQKPKSMSGVGKVLKIRKLALNTLGDLQRKTIRLVVRIPEAVGLTGQWWYHHRPGIRAVGNDCTIQASDCTIDAQESGQQAGCTARTRFFWMRLNFSSILLKPIGAYKYPKFSCI